MQNKIYTKQIRQKDYIKEYLYLIVLAVLFCASVSIVTYDPNDPSTFHRAENYASNISNISNYFGSVGASFSDWSFQLFGLGVVVFLIVFILQILHIFRYKISKTSFYLKIFGYPQLILFYLGFVSGIKPFTNYNGIQILTGGIIGNSVFELCQHVFGTFGALTILFLGAFSSLTLCLGITPLSSVLWLLRLAPLKNVKYFIHHVSEEMPSLPNEIFDTAEKQQNFSLSTEAYRINENVFLDLLTGLTSNTSIIFKQVLQSKEFQNVRYVLPFVYGLSETNTPIVLDIATFPNLLIQAETAHQKTQVVNILILSLMLQKTPSEVKLILIDPQLIEFAHYEGIGHLYMPVITSSHRCIAVLEWIVGEVEKRIMLFKQFKVRNFIALKSHLSLPYLVIVVNEIYDLFVSIPFEFKLNLRKLSAKAHTVGIYMVFATQYPVSMFGDLTQENFPNKLAIYDNQMSFFSRESETSLQSVQAQISNDEIRAMTEKLRTLYPFAIDNIKVK